MLIHKGIVRYIVDGKLAGWTGGMFGLQLRMVATQELLQRIDGQEIQDRRDDDAHVDFPSKVENVQWVNVWVGCAFD